MFQGHLSHYTTFLLQRPLPPSAVCFLQRIVWVPAVRTYFIWEQPVMSFSAGAMTVS